MAKRALLTGINDYNRISDLRGCCNDVMNIRDILKTYFGFENKDIRVLTDSRATQANILQRLEWLTNDAKPGDVLYFHFSGHGSQIRDRDGDELRDCKDEILCCYGMSWSGGYITDDTFDDIFTKVHPDVTFDVVFDSCHSGTGESLLPVRRNRAFIEEAPQDVIGRFLSPPLDIEMRSEGEEDKLQPTRQLMSKSRSERNKHVIWSGCGEQQTSADAYIKGSFNGAFTYYFCKTIRQANGNITRNDLLKRLRSSIRHNRYTQIPELTCQDAVSAQVFLK